MFLSFLQSSKTRMVDPHDALAGRDAEMPLSNVHTVLGTPLRGPAPDGLAVAWFGMGCFWGAERKFWKIPGVYSTSVGYGGGYTENATYEEVCSGKTGHTELVQVVYDPARVSFSALLKAFWESHDPTQGMRQGNDVGTQYRSAIYTSTDAQLAEAIASRDAYAKALLAGGLGEITTEIAATGPFFFAEEYHQQYLDKNPDGYCGLGGTGVSCPIGVDLKT